MEAFHLGMKIATTLQVPLYNQVGNYHWKWDRNSFVKVFMSIIEASSITGNDDGIDGILNESDDECGEWENVERNWNMKSDELKVWNCYSRLIFKSF